MKKLLSLCFVCFALLQAKPVKGQLKTGDSAIDFTLLSLQKDSLRLSEVNKKSTVVLVVLRGWPTYQCPICSRQVGEYILQANAFKKQGAKVVFVYPGPSEYLDEKAAEFTENFDFPENFYFLLDPDYSMVNKYGLRWDAPKETAYPTAYIINKKGKIIYSKISNTHGGRAKADEVLEALVK